MASRSRSQRNAKEPEANQEQVSTADAAGHGNVPAGQGDSAVAGPADGTAPASPTDDTAAPAADGTATPAESDSVAMDEDAGRPEEPVEDGDQSEDSATAGTADDDASDDVGPASTLWTETDIHPVEIALPSGVGYTLRAYRLSSDVTPTDIVDREDYDPFAGRPGRSPLVEDADDDEVVILDEEFNALLAEPDDEEKPADKAAAEDPDADAEADADDTGDPEDDDEDAADESVAEDVPVFLTHRGRLLLFKSPEALVSFVRSDAQHDLAQLESWSRLAAGVQPADVQAGEGDTYELDLVVENLRGGPDVWQLDLLIRAGEIARDLAYGLRLTAVLTALAPGSPLDELDEALRAASAGGFGGYRGRRRLRRIGAQQASLGWRTIIGKISAAVDWRD